MKIIKELIPYVIIVLVVVLIRSFIITPVVVEGKSMEPNFYENEVLLLSKISYRLSDINRFDVVVVKSDDLIIKRVIGLPGDYIEYKNDKLYINGVYVKEDYDRRETYDFSLNDICNCSIIPQDKYLVLGDNRVVSKDSRSIGLIDKSNIVGKTVLRIWPLTKISLVN